MIDRTQRVFVEGVDYSSEGIDALRDEVIRIRNKGLDQLPEAAGFVVIMSHVCALLSDYAHMRFIEEQHEATQTLGWLSGAGSPHSHAHVMWGRTRGEPATDPGGLATVDPGAGSDDVPRVRPYVHPGQPDTDADTPHDH